MTAPPVGGATTAQLLQPDVGQCFVDGVMCPVGSTTSMSSAPGDFLVNATGNGYVQQHHCRGLCLVFSRVVIPYFLYMYKNYKNENIAATRHISLPQNTPKCSCGRGFTPGSTGVAHNAPQTTRAAGLGRPFLDGQGKADKKLGKEMKREAKKRSWGDGEMEIGPKRVGRGCP